MFALVISGANIKLLLAFHILGDTQKFQSQSSNEALNFSIDKNQISISHKNTMIAYITLADFTGMITSLSCCFQGKDLVAPGTSFF